MTIFRHVSYDSMVQIWSWFNGSDHIAISAFLMWEFLTTPSPGIQNSEMESDQRPRSNFDLTAKVISRFCVSRVREVREPHSFDFPVSDMTIFHHVSYDLTIQIWYWFNDSDHIVISTFLLQSVSTLQLPVSETLIAKTPKWSASILHFKERVGSS